ncbi:MAG: MMPL family transporter [Gammaproteobacteria bacterium]|nr:MMPL family transporter [Gammaproteobacteria bacterium]
MLNSWYSQVIRFPRATLAVIAVFTVLGLTQFGKLRWETDARVYFPKGHPAIVFDEKVADTFGVKDSIIIAIENDHGVFNAETLARIKRVTDKVEQVPGVLVERRQDVASLSNAGVFVGTRDELYNDPLMKELPSDDAAIAALKARVYEHADLFVGNLVSKDGTAAMIRARLKEGKEYRYQAYFMIKGILASELGGVSQGDWQPGDQTGGNWGNANWDNKAGGGGDNKSGGWGGGTWPTVISDSTTANGDRFYIAGRPVIEVTSGLQAIDDMMIMIPILVLAIAATLFIIFRTLRGTVLPLLTVAIAIVWTMGLMAALGAPMYTISTMLPVILVAVGIGNGIHLLSHYEDVVMEDPHREPAPIVTALMQQLGLPMLITSVTTMIGFLSLLWADMPPFRIFGVYTALGIGFCWLVSVTLIPAALTLMRPHVSGYLQRRRSLRVHEESGLMTRGLVALARLMIEHRKLATAGILAVAVIAGYGARSLYVDSSWIADFQPGSEVVRSTQMLNDKFDGTVFLSVIVAGKQPDALKSPALLHKIEALQQDVEQLPYVGSSLSLVDYLKSTNKTFHLGDPKFDRLPDTQAEIGEQLFLLSMSGRPEQLDAVVDYEYRQANVVVMIKTDHTQNLKVIIEHVKDYAAREFAGMDVDVNLASSANNSYIWADLLISSQVKSILLSKVGIFIIAALLFTSLLAGLYTVLPVTLTTLLVAGIAGWLRVPLDVSTVLAAGVAIGVGVDYAVHYIFRYAYEVRSGSTEVEASLGAVRSVGKAIVLNAAVVTVGFMVLLMSRFPPHVKLGVFVSAYMVGACVAALLLLPLLFAWLQPRFARSAASQHD